MQESSCILLCTPLRSLLQRRYKCAWLLCNCLLTLARSPRAGCYTAETLLAYSKANTLSSGVMAGLLETGFNRPDPITPCTPDL